MTKILILSDINSPHTQKWALSLAGKGLNIGIFSLSKVSTDWFKEIENITVLSNPVSESLNVPAGILKAFYPVSLPALKWAIRKFKPDIVHAHYASSYGFLGALSGFHPFIISVWGSDVYQFPQSGPIQKAIFKYNLKKADLICSTSETMAGETRKYTAKDISVIPFGIDLNKFKPFDAHHVFSNDTIVIGSIKTLEYGYGMDYLIDAFSILRKRLKNYPLKLLIVGRGSLEKRLKDKVKDLMLEVDTVFTGYISPSEIPFYHNMLSMSVFPSLSESFGVAAVEAMACEKPVVASNVGGLPEVIEDGVTGILVPPANAEKLADALEKLVKDKPLRDKLGKQGRERVVRLYNWENNLVSMISVYDKFLK